MIDALADAILPIFAVAALGFALGRAGLVDQDAPRGINRFVLLAAVPALLFSVLAVAPLDGVDWAALATYAAAEAAVYAAGFALARLVFRRELAEAVLLGFAAAFVNHVLFVMPVARNLYGDVAAPPIALIVALDSLLVWPATVLAMEAIAGAGASAAVVAGRVLRNPMVIGPTLGIAVNLAGLAVPEGVLRYAGFAGAAAAPAALFALGVTLSASDLRRFGGVSVSIAALAVVAHPALVWGINGLRPETPWSDLALLVAAGPCGAMPYALAIFYGAPPHSIAKAIVLSSGASLLTLAALA